MIKYNKSETRVFVFFKWPFAFDLSPAEVNSNYYYRKYNNIIPRVIKILHYTCTAALLYYILVLTKMIPYT